MPLHRLLVYSDARGRGGAEHSLGHLIAHLPRQVHVDVVGPEAGLVRWFAGRRPGSRPHVADGVPALHRLFRRLAPQVVHINRCAPWACTAGLTAALILPTARVTVVDQLPLRTVDPAVLLRTRALTRRVDAAVAVGQASARRLEDFFALGRGSVHSIPNYVPDPGVTSPAPRPAGPLRLVSVGRLDPMKGQEVLLSALAEVPRATLSLLGEGGARQALEATVAELRLSDRVRLPGWTEDVAGQLPSYDVMVLPSRTEGWPLSIVEAMLAGLPVVATAVGSVPELVQHGSTGLLVDKDDPAGLSVALRRLRDDPALRERLGRRGREVAAARMTAPQMSGQWLRLWDQLLSRPRGPRLRPAAGRP